LDQAQQDLAALRGGGQAGDVLRLQAHHHCLRLLLLLLRRRRYPHGSTD
jgi:hypothetical protein